MLLPLLLASSLWQAAATSATTHIACFEEKSNIVCYNSSGQPLATVWLTKKESIADPLAGDILANLIGTAADLGSTDWAIGQNVGCFESNPLLPRVESRVAGKIALSAFRGTVSYILRRRGHKRAADVFRYAGLATDLLLTTNNLHCGLKKRKP